MHFLPDVWVQCETCKGQRYNPDTLAVRYHGQSIADVLAMPCSEAVGVFTDFSRIQHILQTLCDVGLGYLTLGQSAPTLSGGEAQRVKLAAELARPDTGRTLYILDEPTTGLHFEDLVKLLDVLNRLVDQGNTVIVIEHNLDVIKSADWVIDLGPEAGAEGGRLVAVGTPEEITRRQQRPASRKNRNIEAVKTGKNSNDLSSSHTAVALAPVLAAGPHQERKPFSESSETPPKGDLQISEVGRDTKMPWEVDGQRWHTRDRVARDGQSCHWDGQILAEIEARIHQLGEFRATNWNSRTIVEITAPKKSDGWFFHAITGEPWLVKLKFRTAKKTFQRDELVANLGLVPLNDLHEVEAYGNGPRIKCKNLRGPWQEVQIDVHSWQEINTPQFWSFLKQAIAGFEKFTGRVKKSPEDIMPWKVLGQKWHLSRKGFPPGKKPAWGIEVLEDLLEILAEEASSGQFLWNNQEVVHLMLPKKREPWASIYTKRLAAVDLVLNGPQDAFALGRIVGIGSERSLLNHGDKLDRIKFRFIRSEDLDPGDLEDFLKEHLEIVRGAVVPQST
jgi:excinuclease ABC subunit A